MSWLFATHVEAQPMRGFSQRSRLSNSICHVLMLSVPLCIAFLGGTWMRTRRSFSCSAGTPESTLTSTATGTVILPLSLLRCSISSGRAKAVFGSSGAVSEDAQRAAELHEKRNQILTTASCGIHCFCYTYYCRAGAARRSNTWRISDIFFARLIAINCNHNKKKLRKISGHKRTQMLLFTADAMSWQ